MASEIADVAFSEMNKIGSYREKWQSPSWRSEGYAKMKPDMERMEFSSQANCWACLHMQSAGAELLGDIEAGIKLR